MQQDRRKMTRRDGDEFLTQALETLQSIERVSRGEAEDYTEHYVNLVGAKDGVGRRSEDQRLGELLCSTIESIADNIDRLLSRERNLRQVKITKVSGKNNARVPSYTSIEGWAADRPQVGHVYRIYTYNAAVFQTSQVIEAKRDYFQTQNSLYRIEVLQ